MNDKILIAEKDERLRALLKDMLKKQGYRVAEASCGQEALDVFFALRDISLCIFNVDLPSYTGFEVLETLREHSEVAVVLVSDSGEDREELRALRLGADDYLARPFSYEILLARVKNLLLKKEKAEEKALAFGDFKLDLRGHSLALAGEELVLNPKEYALFALFSQHLGQVFTREQLLDKVWGYDYEGEIRTVDTHIKMLRKKLGGHGDVIVTIRGTGYKMAVS